ncbi:MAG: 16S rRNA (uracil(1498)-N(3))-methyltransferase [Bacteroidales bacterium]|nr:16S rRNA (uracil(1498)-N(3))-methyltransferase [Bacteroidales bacterium]
MRLFYAPDIQGENYIFSESESKHIAKVLRLNVGDALFITDGKGSFYEAQISDVSAKQCQVQIIRKTVEKKHSYYLHVAIAPTKNIDRYEWFLEKATEIGIDEITPLVTHNSERKVVKEDRLQKVLEAAMKQSYKAYHPKLNPLTSWSEFLKNKDEYDINLIAHCYESNKHSMKQSIQAGASVLVLIGPEGDFTLEELAEAEQAGFLPLSLGSYRLRTETAGLVAVQNVAFINQ